MLQLFRKLGRFLFQARRDPNFATAVEWTDRPELKRAVIWQTYHLDDEHLVHVNNINAEWPLRVRLSFPRLPEGGWWIVRDAMKDLYYCRDGKSAEWSCDNLLAGLIVAQEPRSDLFVLLSPTREAIEPDTSVLVRSRGSARFRATRPRVITPVPSRR